MHAYLNTALGQQPGISPGLDVVASTECERVSSVTLVDERSPDHRSRPFRPDLSVAW